MSEAPNVARKSEAKPTTLDYSMLQNAGSESRATCQCRDIVKLRVEDFVHVVAIHGRIEHWMKQTRSFWRTLDYSTEYCSIFELVTTLHLSSPGTQLNPCASSLIIRIKSSTSSEYAFQPWFIRDLYDFRIFITQYCILKTAATDYTPIWFISDFRAHSQHQAASQSQGSFAFSRQRGKILFGSRSSSAPH